MSAAAHLAVVPDLVFRRGRFAVGTHYHHRGKGAGYRMAVDIVFHHLVVGGPGRIRGIDLVSYVIEAGRGIQDTRVDKGGNRGGIATHGAGEGCGLFR